MCAKWSAVPPRTIDHYNTAALPKSDAHTARPIESRVMNFALLGDAPEVQPLLRAICATPEHQVTALYKANDSAGCCPAAVDCPSIQAVQQDSTIEAVIVASESDEVLKAAREMAEAGKSLLVLPLYGQDLGVIYELSLVTADEPITLFPIWPLRQHPLVVQLRQLLDEGELGVVQYLELNRTLVPASDNAQSPFLTKSQVDRAFLADIDLLRDLGGNYSLVTTLRTGTDEALSSLITTLACDQAPQATWMAKVDQEETWQLKVAGMRSTAVLSGNPAESSLTLQADGPDFELPQQTAEDDWGPSVLASFLAARDNDASEPKWEDIQRGMELMHATDRSLRRKRTIELFFEAHSERSNFKTQMTAIGCCLIMLTLLGVIVVLVGGQAGLPPVVMSVLRVAVFAPLGIFLLLQALYVLAKPAATKRPTATPRHDSS